MVKIIYLFITLSIFLYDRSLFYERKHKNRLKKVDKKERMIQNYLHGKQKRLLRN